MAFEFDHDEPPHLNFRTFVNALEADGDIANIHKECDPYLEVAAITRYANENRLEAPLFHNVKGAKGGLFRILGSPGCYRQHTAKDKYGRIARHLALPPTATMKEITERLVCGSDETPVDPVSVDAGSAPCKEMKVNDVDLEALPSPQIHLADGGRYIQTYGIHIVKSPDGKWENWAVSRAMIHDKTHLVTAMIWPQHLWKIKEMWKALGKDCPWALAIGVPPAALMAGAAPLADGVSEPGYIGAMTGSPLKVVKCETNDLMVPANSEIVFEGTIDVNAEGDEGPLGEMHGYNTIGKSHKVPLVTVRAITHRENAILPMCFSGRSSDESHTIPGPCLAATMIIALRHAGIPYLNVALPVEVMMIWAVVQVPLSAFQSPNAWTRDRICREIGRVLFGSKPGTYVHKIMVVGDDIDIYDFDDVLWAYTTRCLPTHGEIPFDDVNAWVLLPSVAQDNGRTHGAKVVCNCILPSEEAGNRGWEESDFKGAFPVEVQEKVLQEWDTLGFEKKTRVVN